MAFFIPNLTLLRFPISSQNPSLYYIYHTIHTTPGDGGEWRRYWCDRSEAMAGGRRRGLRWREIWNKVWWCMPLVVSDSPRLMFVVEANCYLTWRRDWIRVKRMAALNGGAVLGGGGALQVNLFNQSHPITRRSFSQFLWDK